MYGLEEINQVFPLHSLIGKQKLSHFGHIMHVEDDRLKKPIMMRTSEDKR